MALPITGLSNTFDCIILLVAWVIVGRHLRRTNTLASGMVKDMRNYFLYFAAFNAFMALPCLLLYINPELFPSFMGWSYSIANIFLLVSLSFLSGIAITIAPRWSGYRAAVIRTWMVINAVLFVLNVMFVALRNQPTFNTSSGITEFQIPAFLGPILGVISLAAYGPVIILFMMNAVRNSSERLKSILLASGMALIMTVGPLHAAAGNGTVFVIADLLNIISLALLATGVIYRSSVQDDMSKSRLSVS